MDIVHSKEFNNNNYQKNKIIKDHIILPSEIKDNVLTFEIKDYNIFNIYNCNLHLTYPEIKGIGKIAFIKDYDIQIIKNYSITYINPDGSKYLFDNVNTNYLKDISFDDVNKNKLCEECEGENLDDIIFEKFNFMIPIKIATNSLHTYPETIIKIEIALNKFTNILTYDKSFKIKSLESLEKHFENSAKNYALTFISDISNVRKDQKPWVIKTFSESHNKCSFFSSQKFANTNMINVYSKMNHFNNGYRFLFNPGSNFNENIIVQKFIDNFKDDLIIFVEKNNKPENNKNIYLKVENNLVEFSKNKKCEIIIYNVPDNLDIYFHSNVLSYERRYDDRTKLNISHLFKKIEAIFINKNKLLFTNITHDIKIIHASIPVEFWRHQTNTSQGDRRSDKSKSKDFYYSNPIITGIDFSSKQELIKKVETDIYHKNLKFKLIDNINANDIYKYNNKNYTYFSLRLCTMGFIYSDENEGLSNFYLQIMWDEDLKYSIFDLFIPIVVCEILEYRLLNYNNGIIEISDKILTKYDN